MNNESIQKLRDVVTRLRAPDGCPWDREQTHQSIKNDLIEEAYELLEAIESDNTEDMVEELGDLLLQIIMHAQIASETNRFDFDQVAEKIAEKLIRRHPHVFADANAADSAEVLANWDRIKKSEKSARNQPTSILTGVPKHLPALQQAHQMQKRAARTGFDWPTIEGAMDKLHEELEELKEAMQGDDPAHTREELGDLLFSVVNVARHLGENPEETMREANQKFKSRFQGVEQLAAAQHVELNELNIDELELLWQTVKKNDNPN